MSTVAVARTTERRGVRQPVTPFDPSRMPPPVRGRNRLRRVLVAADVAAIASAWLFALIVVGQMVGTDRSVVESVVDAALATAIGVAIASQQDLYLSRVSSVRTAEIAGLFRVAAWMTVVVAIGLVLFDRPFRGVVLAMGGLTAMCTLLVARGCYRVWLSNRRKSGAYLRDVVLVGANEEAAELIEIIGEHPEFGLRVNAVLGDRADAHLHGLANLWAGDIDDAAETIGRLQVTGAIVAVSAVPSASLNSCVRDLMRAGVHVQVTSALRGIAHRRLRAQPIAHEPLFYLEPATLSGWQLFVKRATDVAVAGTLLLVTGPVIVVGGLLVRLHDGGPMFFRQERVGRNGERFRMVKIRTMVVDAEQRLEEVRAANNERSGPLFKDENDPRFTRVGRFLDATSLNELPQLWNVLRGHMSLVGPRPALPSEIASFDDALHARHQVRPGITGLWQVEARDNPAFSAYRRYDLFYVENWSVAFDLVIMLATAETVVARLSRMVARRTSDAAAPAEASART